MEGGFEGIPKCKMGGHEVRLRGIAKETRVSLQYSPIIMHRVDSPVQDVMLL